MKVKKKTEIVTIRTTKEMKLLLEEISIDEQISITSLIENALCLYIDELKNNIISKY